MRNYTKPTLTTIDNYIFESVYTSSGDSFESSNDREYQTCCGCHGRDAGSYASFYECHCMNCSNLLGNGYCLYGKNSGSPTIR